MSQLQCIQSKSLSAHYELVSDIDATGTDEWQTSSFTEIRDPVYIANETYYLFHTPVQPGTVSVTRIGDGSSVSFELVDPVTGKINITETTDDGISSTDDRVRIDYEVQSPVTVGFDPIGDYDSDFRGSLDGNGHTISGLTINRSNRGTNVGLFTTVGGGTVEDVTLSGADIDVNNTDDDLDRFPDVGVVAGWNEGTIRNVTVGGELNHTGSTVGGLVGYNAEGATVRNATAHVRVWAPPTQSSDIGGLVGSNSGTVVDSRATGDVTGEFSVGGLVGGMSAVSGNEVVRSSATGNVSGQRRIGGLVGNSDGRIAESYATGNVSGSVESVGGLVGHHTEIIVDSYATGDVTGGDSVGGLVGNDQFGRYIRRSYAVGAVSGEQDVGGLVGQGFADVSNTYWNTETTGQDDSASDSTALRTPEMLGPEARENMQGFDFSDTWRVVERSIGTNRREVAYPLLRNNTQSPAPGLQRQRAPACSALGYRGNGTSSDPYRIGNLSQLQCMGAQSRSASYRLVSDINATNTSEFFSGRGFEPIGTESTPFTGNLDGDGYAITNLTIDRPGASKVGLFGKKTGGTIRDLRLSNVSITGGDDTGGLAGETEEDGSNVDPTIRNVTVTGNVTGSGGVGGLVGSAQNGDSGGNTYLIANATTAVTVTGSGNSLGGLVGSASNPLVIRDSRATGEVNGSDTSDGVGGLVGAEDARITDSVATGTVSGDDKVGGLVGFYGTARRISNVTATGNVRGDEQVGGLVGGVIDADSLADSSATGNVSGTTKVGGLVGRYAPGSAARVRNVAASGDVDASASHAGGLVGYLVGSSDLLFVSARGDVHADSAAGGLVGTATSGSGGQDRILRVAAATGNVSVDTGTAGGLVGDLQAGSITSAYATGAVSGGATVGGLVGSNAGLVNESYAAGAVSGTSTLGGLVGDQSGTLNRSYWDVAATGQSAAVGTGSASSSVVGFDTPLDEQGRADKMTGLTPPPANMVALDFVSPWTVRENDYPTFAYLAGEGPPLARNDSYTTIRSVSAPGVLANDLDPERDALSATGIAESPAHGTASVDADGSITYEPERGFLGTDSFVYRVSDGDDTHTAGVSVTVTNPVLPYSGLTVNRTFVQDGESVTVAVNVTNPTGASISETVELTANGEVVRTRTITLAAGETRHLSFDVVPDPGVQRFSFTNLDATDSVTVPDQTRPWTAWHLPPGNTNYDARIDGPTPPLDRAWDTTLPDGGSSVPVKLIVANDTVFGQSYASTFAMDAETGTVKWSNASVGGSYLGGVAYANGTLYASTYSGLIALDGSTGDSVWERNGISVGNHAPVVVNGTVYTSTYDRSVVALNSSTGATVWNYTYSDGRPPFYSTVTVANGRVFVPLQNGTFVAHDADTGDVLWRQSGIGYSSASPAVQNGTVYIGDSSAPHLHALDVETGAFRWNASAGYAYTGLSVTEDTVITATCGDSVYAYDANTGAEKWNRTGVGCAYGIQEPVTVGNVVYATNYDSETLALNRYTGATEFTLTNPAGDDSLTAPTPHNGRLYIATRYNDKVYAYNSSSNQGSAVPSAVAKFGNDGTASVSLGGNVSNVSVSGVSGGTLSVVETTASGPADGVSRPPGSTVAVYLDIEVFQASGGGTVTMNVSRSSLNAANLGVGSVTLLHFVDGEWTELRTRIVSTSGDTVTLRANVKSFSPFAVGSPPSNGGGGSTDDDGGDTTRDRASFRNGQATVDFGSGAGIKRVTVVAPGVNGVLNVHRPGRLPERAPRPDELTFRSIDIRLPGQPSGEATVRITVSDAFIEKQTVPVTNMTIQRYDRSRGDWVALDTTVKTTNIDGGARFVATVDDFSVFALTRRGSATEQQTTATPTPTLTATPTPTATSTGTSVPPKTRTVTPTATSVPTDTPAATPTTAPENTGGSAPGFGAVIAIIGLIATAGLLLRRHDI